MDQQRQHRYWNYNFDASKKIFVKMELIGIELRLAVYMDGTIL
jgi:hypothetical protein